MTKKQEGNYYNTEIKDEMFKTLHNGYNFKAKILTVWSFQTFPQNSRGKNSITQGFGKSTWSTCQK